MEAGEDCDESVHGVFDEMPLREEVEKVQRSQRIRVALEDPGDVVGGEGRDETGEGRVGSPGGSGKDPVEMG